MADIFDQIHGEKQKPTASGGDFFDQIHAERNPAQSRGFLGELWSEVKNGPANLLGIGNAINEAVLHPYQTIQGMGQQIQNTATKTKESLQRGDYLGAGRHAINTGINAVAPGLGSSSDEAGDMYERGDYAGGTGKTIGMGVNVAVGAKTPQVMRGAAKVVSGEANPANLWKVDPRIAINRSLRPVPSNPDFPEHIPEALSLTKEANRGKAPGGITAGKLDMIPAVEKAIEQQQGALEKWLARAKGVQVSGDELVAATRQAIPKLMWTRDPAAAQALIDQAQQTFGGRRFSVQEFRDFLRTENADLSGFYNKAPGAQQSAATAGTPTAIEAAQTDAIRKVLYNALDPEGAGAGPRLIQQRTGALYDIRNAALRRNNAIVAEQPLTPIGRVIDPFKAALRSMMPGKATGAGIAFAEGSEGRSLPLINRAFKAVGEPSATPLPGEPLYPTGNPQRQLPAPNQPGKPGAPVMARDASGNWIWDDQGRGTMGGTMYTPPPADASSVRGVPAMAQPPNPRLALPASSTIITPAPPDASSVRSTPAMTQPPNPRRALPPPGKPPQDVIDLDIGSQFGDRLIDPNATRPRRPMPPLLRPR